MVNSKQLKARTASRLRRHARVRAKVVGSAVRPRLSVFRSSKYIYAQLIDDGAARTLLAADDRQVKTATKGAKSKEVGAQRKVASSYAVGELLAAGALKKNIKQVVFDRGGYLFAGRVKALAAGARAGGLQF